MFTLHQSRQVIHGLKNQTTDIFLTFDDGPSAETTPQVLDILQQENVQASFFVIGRFARQEPALLKRILNEGHGVFSHSSDHDYRHYFHKQKSLQSWIQESLHELEQLTSQPQRIFRPPAGILTPPLLLAAQELHVPLVLWNQRFFDTARTWTKEKADQGAQKLIPGSIILLHDRQKPWKIDKFGQSLRHYIRAAKARSFRFARLSQDQILSQIGLGT